MTICVLDSSLALAWSIPDEDTGTLADLLDQIGAGGAIAPDLWLLETTNALLMVQRRGRITLADRQRALRILAELPVDVERATGERVQGEILAIATAKNLTVYDAAYLELALRRGLPLASLDRALCRAASECGVATLTT